MANVKLCYENIQGWRSCQIHNIIYVLRRLAVESLDCCLADKKGLKEEFDQGDAWDAIDAGEKW